MKLIDSEKLITEIERQKEHLSASELDERGAIIAFGVVLGFITILQKERPFRPSNLDEAADHNEQTKATELACKYGWGEADIRKQCFITGAEWMAGQGETHETEIVSRINARGLLPAVTCLVDNSYKEGDKVVVQIRKK